MGGELRIRVAEERTPPQLDGLEVDEEEWRLSLEGHRDLLCDLTGVDPEGDLTLQDLVTIRARLEGYVERTNRRTVETDGGDARTTERDRTRASRAPLRALKRLLSRLRAVVSRGWTGRSRDDDSATRRPDDPPYSEERARRLATVFRAAAADRRREIVDANDARTADETAD